MASTSARPGMLFASIERAPSFGVRVKSFDASEALRIPGVRSVVPVTSGIHPGIAVVARDSWTALRGRQALKIVWDETHKTPFDSASFLEGVDGGHLPRVVQGPAPRATPPPHSPLPSAA